MTGLAYAPFATSRSASAEKPAYELFGDLQQRAAAARTPENLQGLAIAQLEMGMKAAPLELLEEAVRLKPDDPSLLSDLAAAELADGRVADAAEHSIRASELAPELLEAAFNRAVTMERLWNRPAAIRAWRRYLELDGGSEWGLEAQRRLDALTVRRTWAEDRRQLVAGADGETIRRLVAQYPRHARTRVENILLPAWAKSGNAQELELMRAMATEREEADPFLRDVVEHASNARAAVVPGILAYERGFHAANSGDFAAAASAYEESAEALHRAVSPLARVASIQAATFSNYSGRADAALWRLDDLDRQMAAEGNRYPAMIVESAWLRGLILSRRGDPSGSLTAFQRAVAAARQSGEIEHEVAVRQLLATLVEITGDPLEAERERLTAVRLADTTEVDPDRMFEAYGDMAFSALRAGRPWLAREFAQSQTEVTKRLNGAHWPAENDAQRALALLEIGRLEAAAASLASAREHALRIVDHDYRGRVLANIDYTAGRLAQLRSRPAEAVAAYSAAIRWWESSGWRLHSAVAHLSCAEANLSAGRRAEAERNLRAGIGEMEKQRRGFGEPAMRIAYFERAERLFERLIELLAGEGRHADALSVAEQKRARALLDQITADGTGVTAEPLDSAAIASRIAPGTAVLEMVLLERGAEIWLVHGGRIVHARSAASRAQIEHAVSRLGAAIEARDDAAVRREGRWLYAQLVAPVERALPPGHDLAIVPDGVLQFVPFATLVTPANRYLLETHPLTTVPSASVLIRAAEVSPSGRSLLAVAQPAPEGLDPLIGAKAEAMHIAGRHPAGRLLVGVAVTPGEFLEAASRAAWVHFAGHAKAGRRTSQSSLVFETAAGPPVELDAGTIARSRLTSRPLVVLAACSTGRGKLRRNEGIESLAAAFLQAGARGVVATLWDVDDASSATLFRSFHQNLREGARPADALRSAQLALLRGPDPRDRSPSVWASAILEGTF